VKDRMLKNASGFVLASFRPSTYGEYYLRQGAFPLADDRNERIKRSLVCTSSVPHLLRPCRRTFLTILQQDQLGSYACDMHNDGRTSLGD
jgi:hypothetical protein